MSNRRGIVFYTKNEHGGVSITTLLFLTIVVIFMVTNFNFRSVVNRSHIDISDITLNEEILYNNIYYKVVDKYMADGGLYREFNKDMMFFINEDLSISETPLEDSTSKLYNIEKIDSLADGQDTSHWVNLISLGDCYVDETGEHVRYYLGSPKSEGDNYCYPTFSVDLEDIRGLGNVQPGDYIKVSASDYSDLAEQVTLVLYYGFFEESYTFRVYEDKIIRVDKENIPQAIYIISDKYMGGVNLDRAVWKDVILKITDLDTGEYRIISNRATYRQEV